MHCPKNSPNAEIIKVMAEVTRRLIASELLS